MEIKEARALFIALSDKMPAEEALLEAARAWTESKDVIYPANGQWSLARMALGALADGQPEVAAKAFRLWQTSRGASGRVLLDDETIRVTDAAERAGVTRRFIQDEINAGKLPAKKDAKGRYAIRVGDFQAWMANPRRGSRS